MDVDAGGGDSILYSQQTRGTTFFTQIGTSKHWAVLPVGLSEFPPLASYIHMYPSGLSMHI